MVDDLPEYGEGESLVLQEEEEEASDKVHTLAIVERGVDDRVCVEDPPQVLVANIAVVLEGPIDVHFNVILNSRR